MSRCNSGSLVTSRKHRFARRRRIAFTETLDEDAIGMQQGSTLQAFLAQITDNLGKQQKLRVQLSNLDAMCRMIGSGVGIGHCRPMRRRCSMR